MAAMRPLPQQRPLPQRPCASPASRQMQTLAQQHSSVSALPANARMPLPGAHTFLYGKCAATGCPGQQCRGAQ
ncbi:hypothetical protein CBR_g48219 [Chara braunii]|uniref:Uncharacterized protein n=1 Tax=Chara braunii TaxID=69332 RepID=A0A388M2I1_CHABU|nr:hypothetical protein CBR_g48219 [Chara braunii]|eukprot:GBG88689.1 hypothetical protein CBR_g48219 [Chara braunii]